MGLRRRELALSSAVNRSWIRGPVPGGGFSPLRFGSALAAWYDAVDPSTLFQDSALTTAAAADADPVGGWKDKSGRGKHAVQATNTKRPTLKLAVQNGLNALRPDGVDDELDNAAFGGLSFDQLSLYVAAKAGTPAAITCLVRLRDSALGDIFTLFQLNATNKIRAQYVTSAGNQTVDTAAAYTSGFVAVLTVDASSNYLFRVNGAELTGTLAGTKVVRAVDTLNLFAAAGSNPWGTDGYEVFVSNVAQDRITALKGESYLRSKWGI